MQVLSGYLLVLGRVDARGAALSGGSRRDFVGALTQRKQSRKKIDL